MRAIGVVTELRQPAGLYIREGSAEPDVVAEAYARWRAAAAAQLGVAAGAAIVVAPAVLTVAAYLPVLGAGMYLYDLLFAKRKPLVRVPALGPSDTTASVPERVIVVPARTLAGDYGDYDAPLFHGLFARKDDLATVMSAEGGNVDLMIVDQPTANSAFRHYLGAPFSTGIHLPHPKDPAVLIPANDYASALLKEVHAEWVQTLESLGARRIVIADSTEVRAKAGGAKEIPGAGDIGVEMRDTYGAANVDEATYAAGTFDPERAVRGRRWIRDYPEMVSIIEGRVHGNQASWRRSIKVNAEFGISSEVLGVFKASLSGGMKRTYEFSVDFFPRK